MSIATRSRTREAILTTNKPPTDQQTLKQAIAAFIAKAKPEDRELTSRELSRFGRWLGADTPVSQIEAEQVFLYQEQFATSKADLNLRLAPVKAFLKSLNNQRATAVNLGAAIRLRPASRRRARDKKVEDQGPVRITPQGHVALSEELRDLEERARPEVTEQLRSAAADKDFSENAPYSAAKHRLGEIRSRISSIRATLDSASVYTVGSTATVDLGTIVTLYSLTDKVQDVHAIVGAGEMRARDASISVQSPMGRALMERRVGDVVEVETPTGPHRYRIDKIERR